MTTTIERSECGTWTPRYHRINRTTGAAYRTGGPFLLTPPTSSSYARRVSDIRAGGSERQSARPVTRHGLIRFSSDRVHKAVIETLACGFTFTPDDPQDLPYSRSFQAGRDKDRLEGRLGFRMPPTERAREQLDDSRSQLIKLQFALWARAYAETDADPHRPTVVTLSQLCEDLGYRRLQNGAHRPEHKRQVAEWVELLTSIQVEGEYRAPDGRWTRLSGPLWKRFPDWEADRVIAFAPGTWYADPVWSNYNRRVGLIGAGLLTLRPDRDRWAIGVGAYLATLARMNGYRSLTVRVATVLERTGLQEAERRNPSRMREMLERALEQLEAAGVIAEWDWFNADPSEPDMDAPSDLFRLSDEAPHWSKRSLVIRWPASLREREEALRSRREARPSARRTGRVRTAP